MAFAVKDRVKETSSTTGTGSLSLAGAVTGYQSFNAALSNGDTTYYVIEHFNTSEWETGLGTFTSPSTLARTTVLSSSTGSVVSFTAGTKNVFISLPATQFPAANTTIVGTDAIQTLTNKSISGASNAITNVSLTSGVTGTLPVANGGTGVTGFGVVTSKTASYAVLAADSYKDFDNNGAAGTITFTLPASTVGLAYGFAVMEAQDLVIDAPGGVTIYLGALATTAGGTITSNAVGSYLFVKCRSATEWIVQSSMGSWSAQ